MPERFAYYVGLIVIMALYKYSSLPFPSFYTTGLFRRRRRRHTAADRRQRAADSGAVAADAGRGERGRVPGRVPRRRARVPADGRRVVPRSVHRTGGARRRRTGGAQTARRTA